MRTEDLCTIFERMEDEAKEIGMKYEEASRMSRDAKEAEAKENKVKDKKKVITGYEPWRIPAPGEPDPRPRDDNNIPFTNTAECEAYLRRKYSLENKVKTESDGTTADYYELPPGATELQDLISFKNMNSQLGEIGRSWYRYGQASHSDMLRDINKIIFYAQAEKARLEKYVLRSDANIRSDNEPRT